MGKVKREDIKAWQQHCLEIKKAGIIDINESDADRLNRCKKACKDYRFFFEYYFPHYAKSKCSWFHVKMAKLILKHPKISAILEWFRSSAKSTHACIGYPLWLKINKELKVMLLVGENEVKGKRLLADVQAELQFNPRFINDFGQQWSHGNWEEGNFVTSDDVAFFSIGVGQSPRGIRHHENRPDLIVVDDIDTKKKSKNQRIVREQVNWILEDLHGCFDEAVDARQRYLHVNNRIHKQSVLAHMVKQLTGAVHMIVNATNSKGTPEWPERHTREYWIEKQTQVPYRAYQTNYMNNPIEDGALFKHEQIQWKKMLKLSEYDAVIGYGDLSYRAGGDYKAFKIWGKKGRELHCIKAFVRQCDKSDVATWLYDYDETLESKDVIMYYIEGNFIQDDFINDFDEEGDKRGYYIAVVPDKRTKPDKFQRVERLCGFYHRGNVYYNIAEQDNNDMKVGIEQLLAFEKGSGAADDSPDADEGAIYLLMQRGAASSFEPVLGTQTNKGW